MNAPVPLTPPDCDLRGYDFMPLLGARLFQSALYRIAVVKNPRAGLAAIKLWWEAWNQVPCGSLPDDEIELAMMADFGADLKSWRKCADLSLRGFVKCSDGRWYHPILCEEAISAFSKREKHEAKRGKDRERLAKWRDDKFGKRGTKESGNPFHGGGETADETRFTNDKKSENGVSSPRKTDRQLDSNSSLCSESWAASASSTPELLPTVRVAPAEKPKANRGCRIPENWWPSPDLQDFARNEGCDPDRVAAAFVDYWRGVSDRRGVKSDWPATFRNWCRNEQKSGPRGASAPSKPKSALAQQAERLRAQAAGGW